MRRDRVKPMPTEEEKVRAKLKIAGSDPLVWAMKSVDDEFPDAREKDLETIKAEAAVEEVEEEIPEEEYDEIETGEIGTGEIRAEGKTAVPTGDGVVTMEVTPMRQNVDNVPLEEVKKPRASLEEPEGEPEKKSRVKKVAGAKGMAKDSIEEKGTVAKGVAAVKGVVKKVERKTGLKTDDVEADGGADSVKTSGGAKANVKKTSSKKTDDHKTAVKLTSLESKQKKMMIGIIVLLVLALGGVSFGIVAMVKQGQTAEELEQQIATTIAENSDDAVNGDYITLKDWDLRIKVPTGLTNISYNYQTDDYTEVLIWGAKQDTSANYAPDFAKQTKNSNPLGTVVRVPRYERAAAGRLIWYDDYYNYYYQGPTGVPEVSESEMSWWVESYLLIKEMLTNADNYEKISDGTVGQQ